MPAKIAALALLGLFVLALALDKPAIVGVPLALVVPVALGYGGYRMFGWKGAAFNVAGFVAVSLLMLVVLGTDTHHP